MKLKKLHCIGACMPSCVVLISQMVVLPAARAATELPMAFSVGTGQRKDNLSWSIASNTVNVISELKWENLSISQLQSTGEFNLKNDRWLRVKLGYGVINSGTNQDSDYSGNNRTQEFSRSNSKAGGDVLEASIGIGKKLRLRELSAGKTIYVMPSVGLSIHQQNLIITDGTQAIPPLGPFPGLASSYDSQWVGPWLGAEVLLETERGWVMMANAEYHLVGYTAKANWNLRTELAHPVSMRHTAAGEGIVLSLGASYLVGKNWKINFTLEQHQWTTRAGRAQVYFADGTVSYGRLNAVNWDSTSYNFGIVRHF